MKHPNILPLFLHTHLLELDQCKKN
uniref:Uncharacterized protein n=1 Tax=Anopheles minimus TaxID=112268 RepID=A0A182WMV7_9DIPT